MPCRFLPRAIAHAALILPALAGLSLTSSEALAAGEAPRVHQPATTQLPVMDLVEVAPGVHYVQGLSALGSPENQNFISNAGFVETSRGVVVVDALGSPALAQRLVDKIRSITSKPITHVLLTHYHADHIYGLQTFKALGAKIIAHEGGREYLNSETAKLRLQASRSELAPWVDGNTHMVEADEWIRELTVLDIDGVRFELHPMGPAHTPEDLAIFLPDRSVAFVGDIVFRGRIPYVGQADSAHWIASLESLLQLPIKLLVPGHGPMSDQAREDMGLTRDYLVFLRESMRQAARDLEPFDEAYAATDWSRFENLPLFKVANRMNAYNTYLLMESEAQ
ncbi:MBL fold metallo-hydrolase [Comamonas composti]|uniref:MBL fold metallo-hydrolase n=1 Tax=Comamonas composti TaxID=408558 RepID=UPI0004246B71|nr:MBL fold metallo-hydrolase [Comamonas composti]